MNRERYISYLESLNGYCGCLRLQDLFRERRNAERFEAKCDLFKRNVDMDNPSEEDLDFLENYRKSARQFSSIVDKYRSILREKIIGGELRLKLHDDKNFKPLRYLEIREASIIQKLHDNSIMTAHCSECEKQVDII